jgi:replicative DNA helicase
MRTQVADAPAPDMSLSISAPFDMGAEVAVLGSLMLEPSCLDEVEDLITKESFYVGKHKQLYSVVTEVIRRGIGLDLVTLRDHLAKTSQLELVGGLHYLQKIVEETPTYKNVKHYASIMRDRWCRRVVMNSCLKMYKGAADVTEEGGDEFAQRMVLEFAAAVDSTTQDEARDFESLLEAVLSDAEKGGVGGRRSSLNGLHALVPEFCPGDLVVVAGRPSHGKTSLMRGIALDVSEEGPVVVFSMEEGDKKFAAGMLSAESGVPKRMLRAGAMDEKQWGEVTLAKDRLKGKTFLIDPSPFLTLPVIVSRSRKYKRQYKGLSGIVVDYLQLCTSGNRDIDNRNLEIGMITRNLKALAVELECPLFLGSQLRRAHPSLLAGARRPQLQELRDSGSIEADADVVIGVFNWFMEDRSDWARGIVELIVLKDREGGGLGSVVCGIDGARVFDGDKLGFTRTETYKQKAMRRR